MLESVDFTEKKKEAENTPRVRFLFILLSFCYMLPWTAMGSLIHYFAMEHNKNYYTMLNIAFYGVGLPVTYVQKRLDNYYDAMYGSKQTFKNRIHICLITQIVCLMAAPFSGYYGLILVTMVIGIATWVAHSCTTSLSGMVKYNSSIMQQIGFALPAVFGIIASLIFGLGEDEVSDSKIVLFYYSIAVFVAPGHITWYFMHKSRTVRQKLAAKDSNLGSLLIQSAIRKQTETLNPIHEESGSGYMDEKFSSNESNALAERSYFDDSNDQIVYAEATDSLMKSDCAYAEANEQLMESDSLLLSKDPQRIIHDSRKYLADDKSLIKEVMKSKDIDIVLRPYRWTLFCTIFSSILQSSFISYSYGCVLFDRTELPSILYFVRIFADLFGRPLGLLRRPSFVADVDGLLRVSVLRFVFSLYFYSIIVNVFYPHEFVISDTCHLLLIGFQMVFSALSGYLNCLTYEYASAAFDDEWSRVIAAQQLNLTFQQACTWAVAFAMCVLVFVDVIKPAFGWEIHTGH